MHQGKIICNIDQSWLNQLDFRRQKWRAKGSRNSVKKGFMAPRASFFLCLDTRGQFYFSLVQANTNAKIIEIFLHSLT